MKRRFLVPIGIFAMLMLFSSRAFAQVAGSIRGLITDQDFNDQPLAGVNVLVVQTEQTAVSNAQGVYLIENVAPGTYTLIFSREGFIRQVEAEVLVGSAQLTEMSMSMPSEFTELPPLNVQEIRFDAGSEFGLIELRQDLPQFLDSVGEAQLDAAGVGDAAGALSLISGATVNDDKAVIRGLPDRFVSSQVNGVRFPSADTETRSLELDQFPTDVIESIQVSKTFTPDQQADASGGAVNIILKGIPDEDTIKFGVGTEYNTNYTGRNSFRTYAGGGLNTLGIDKDRRNLPAVNPLPVSLGTIETSAPIDYSANLTIGKRHEFADSGWTVGGVLNTFYDRGGSFYDDGREADYAAYNLDPDGAPAASITIPFPPFVIPGSANPRPAQWFFLPDTGGTTALVDTESRDSSVFDLIRSTEEMQWGTLAATGLENEFNRVDLIYLETRTTKDTSIVATDTSTRGIVENTITELEAQAAEPLISSISPGSATGSDLAFVRNQTLQYQERLIRSFQLRGAHTLPVFTENDNESASGFRVLSPEFDWTYAYSSSQLKEPDQRTFQSFYNPDDPAQAVFAANFSSAGNTGYAQRSWEFVTEDSNQIQLNLKMPFVLRNDEEGFLKVGMFRDRVTRDFDRETFTTDPATQVPPSVALPAGISFQDFYLTDFLTDAERTVNFADDVNDVDFKGNYDIDAFYWMLDVPVTTRLRVIGGFRFESTNIGIGLTNIDEFANALDIANNSGDPLLNAGTLTRTINPNTGLPRGDVDYQQDDVLPSLSLIYEATDALTFRGAYSETIARTTFRELSVARQQEFLGSTQFFGNEELRFAAVTNYDFRFDYRPTPGGLISGSVFYKQIEDPIEYVSRGGNNVFQGTVTYPVNFPEGEILGAELEVRQQLGDVWEELTGLTLGANGTLIESEVTVAADQITVPINQTKREMLNAPAYLVNLFAVYSNEDTGTEVGLFYTMRGDTLVAGASPALTSVSSFTPNLFEAPYDTLNFTIAQKLSERLKLKFSAKNLTDPDIQRVYRSSLTPETVQSSYSKGIGFSVSLSADFEF